MCNHFEPNSEIFSDEEQQFYNKICRILISYYLNSIGKLVTLNSNRLKQTNKKDHLRAQRNILLFLRGEE
jgi:hypothetical protein